MKDDQVVTLRHSTGVWRTLERGVWRSTRGFEKSWTLWRDEELGDVGCGLGEAM